METTINTSSANSMFSFKAPFPTSALKHRRGSLASLSSPRVVQAWNFRDDTGLDSQTAFSSTNDKLVPEKKGKMRKIDLSQAGGDSSRLEKKPRKKWSEEETNMLVQGCQKHGVGNWKTILHDPNLQFHDRSAVDLKDRFRTYYPDAYKKHYPNARTHLSSKVRSILPDGTSLFVKARGKRRRPFSEEEDRALKAGYEKHSTAWATIVKNPIFQNRRSTDLRDRFRNAFPALYQAAGYKPRSNKKLDGPIRAADDQLSMSTTAIIGPIRPRRRALASQDLLRGGSNSVPQSAECSEDEDSSGAEDDAGVFKLPPTPFFVDAGSTLSSRTKYPTTNDDDDEMAPLYPGPLNIPDFLPSETYSEMETWSSGINTPTHSSCAWSIAAVSPASSSNFSDQRSIDSSCQSSPFLQRPLSDSVGGTNMIGKSAWGHDWFSSNPRLDNSGTATSFFGDGFSSPASPFSFHPHGVLDRYGLFQTSISSHMSSDMGLFDSAGAGAGYSGSEEMMSGFKGYHSQIAGDLISGARTAHQQPSSGYHGFGDILGLSGVSHQQLDESPMLFDRFRLDDLVDIHTTPPATPPTEPRPLRRSSISRPHHFLDVGYPRSTSVPPIEVRNGTEHSSSSSSVEMHNHLLVPPFFSHPPSRSSTSPDVMKLSNSIGSISMQNSSTTNLFSNHLMLPVSPSSSAPSISPTNNSTGSIWRSGIGNAIAGDNHNEIKNKTNGQTPPSLPLSSFTSNTISPGDLYNLPSFLDLHYYGPTYGSGSSMYGGHTTPVMGSEMDMLPGGMGSAAEMARQGQALDLAQSAVLASSTSSTSAMLGLKHGSGFDFLNSLRQRQSQHQPTTATSTKIGQRVASSSLPTPLLHSLSSPSPCPPSPSPPPSPRTTPQPGPSLVLAPHGGVGTIRQSHITSSSLGRSMSHHRGLPQDLVLRHDSNKRKRVSWDGGAG